MQFVRGTSSVKGSSASQTLTAEVDSRSIYVGNVDYACTAEIVRRHFQSCGIVNRVTILMNEFSLPKGCAYVEFLKIDSVPKALLLNESELHGRKIKVCAKRTNIPGMNQYSGRYTWVLRSRRPPPLYPRPGYGSVPRFRRSMRYRPY
ncbi:polyadenylate-binding protein 1-like isoform X3 [Trifolium pratense]|uniref:polyadenylate-binding protein 1-like isoform X3 n=1 Tax=Trifolium pratense TaxID=57577 RepID=UPI001E697FAF|nr:polyadenylate-binding protein 1-like isoform X3 [Trifolium pratense]XP_045808277.1 polyadenylate-binding protein 1-like isoform X3 [Trifolium pratense]XP_045808279.1 polyadenylate-binding protein 1-like isoform X3 [Trifolium pratense]